MRAGSNDGLISGKKGVVIGMQDLGVMKEREGEERSKEFGDGRRGLGSRLGSHGGKVRRPEEAKLGDIRVASTWEIRVDDK